MELVRADDGTVIGEVGYSERHDTWRARSIHQQGKPTLFYSEERARQWVRRLHDESIGE